MIRTLASGTVNLPYLRQTETESHAHGSLIFSSVNFLIVSLEIKGPKLDFYNSRSSVNSALEQNWASI